MDLLDGLMSLGDFSHDISWIIFDQFLVERNYSLLIRNKFGFDTNEDSSFEYLHAFGHIL